MKKISTKILLVALIALLSSSVLTAQEMYNTTLDKPIEGVFKAVVQAVPNMDTINGAVAFAPGEGAAWGDLSVIIRFNKDGGNIDAHNGVTYALPDSLNIISYAGDSTYIITIEGNVYENTFTAFVTGYDLSTNATVTDTVAKDFGFRASATSITHYVKALQTDIPWGVPGGDIQDTILNLYSTKNTAITFVNNGPVIDGDISDGYWDNALSNLCNTTYGGPLEEDDVLSGYWKAVWTTDSIFILGNVVDNVLEDNGAPTWNTDGFHLYFDLANERDGTGAGVAGSSKVFNQIYYAADGSQPTGGENILGSHMLITNDTGYIVEVSYAWADLDAAGLAFTPENGAKILLDVDIVNFDGSFFPPQLYWSSNDNCWANMNMAGQVELAQLDPSFLVAARDELQTLIDGAVVGQENGEYLQSLVDQANATVASANNVIATAISQTQIDNEIDKVNLMIAVFLPLDFPIASIMSVSSTFVPVVDGDLSEWDVVEEAFYNTVEVGTPVTGNSDLAGYWKAVWSADTLYVMAEVQDSALNDNGAPTWNTDGVHFYFGLLNTRNDMGANGEDDAKLFSQIYYSAAGAVTGGSLNPDNVVLTTTDNGYVVEASYAWTTINKNNVSFTAEAYANILFDCDLVNFNDANQWVPQEKYWGSNQNCWANMNDAGRLELSGEAFGVDESNMFDFSVYPNPVSGVLHLNNISEVKSFSIYTITGKLVNVYTNTQDSRTIDLSDLNKGIYIIQLVSDKGTDAKRIIKE